MFLKKSVPENILSNSKFKLQVVSSRYVVIAFDKASSVI